MPYKAKDGDGNIIYLNDNNAAGTLADPKEAILRISQLPGTTQSDIAAIKAAIELLDNAILADKLQVDIVTAPNSLAQNATLQSIESILTAIGQLVDGLEGGQASQITQLQAIRNAAELLDNAILSNRIQSDVVSLPSHLGTVSGHTRGFPGISATYIRPADVNAYTAGDALSDSTTAPTTLVFPGCARVNGGAGDIVNAHLEVSNVSFPGRITLFLFRATRAATADNAPLIITTHNDNDYVGWIEFDSANLKSSGGSASIPGIFEGFRPLQFTCAANDTSLYGQVRVDAGYTPSSAGVHKFQLVTKPE